MVSPRSTLGIPRVATIFHVSFTMIFKNVVKNIPFHSFIIAIRSMNPSKERYRNSFFRNVYVCVYIYKDRWNIFEAWN